MNLFEARLEVRLQRCAFGSHHRRQPFEPCCAGGQVMGLGIAHHLNPVFNRAGKAVMIAQPSSQIIRNPALFGQTAQARHRATHPQARIAPPCNQLTGLGKKLDLADATPAKFHVVTRKRDRPPGAFMRPNGKAHVMRVLHGGKVQMTPPDKGAEFGQKRLTGLYVSGTSAGFDESSPLPRPSKAFVVPLCRPHRQHDRGHSRIGTQTQIRAKHVAVARQVTQDGAHILHRLDAGLADGHEIVRIVPGLVKQTNQIDVRGIVQFERAHLAHGQNHETHIL